jgi:mannose-6-phosphate isomerase-like protein (cupin superfamily)
MSSDVLNHQARVVVTGFGPEQRSKVVSDEMGPVRFPAPVATSTIAWETLSVPVKLGSDQPPSQDWYLPHVGGLRVFIVAFAPDSSLDEAARQEHLDANALEDEPGSDRPLGFHTTPTVDVLTVIKGELYCLLDDGEVLLQQGDTIVQRATAHSWSNRTDEIVLACATMISAVDDDGRQI